MATYIAHHGVLGMKWGIRRYQNKDGSLTAEGRQRYGVGEDYDPNRPTPEQDLARHNRRVKTAKKVAFVTGATAIGALIISPKAREATKSALKKIGGTKAVLDKDGKVVKDATGLVKLGQTAGKGAKEGASGAVKTFGKVAAFGLVTLGLKEVTDIIAGKVAGDEKKGRQFVDNLYKLDDKDKISKPSSWQMRDDDKD